MVDNNLIYNDCIPNSVNLKQISDCLTLTSCKNLVQFINKSGFRDLPTTFSCAKAGISSFRSDRTIPPYCQNFSHHSCSANQIKGTWIHISLIKLYEQGNRESWWNSEIIHVGIDALKPKLIYGIKTLKSLF